MLAKIVLNFVVFFSLKYVEEMITIAWTMETICIL